MPLPKGLSPDVAARAQRNARKREEYPFRGSFLGKVISPAPDETVTLETNTGVRTTSFAYPFVSRNAWIRGQPEAGSTMSAMIGPDTQELQATGYFDPAKSAAAVRYQRVVDSLRSAPSGPIPQILPYRTLTPGDLDTGSRGAQSFLGLGDVYQASGGLSHFSMTSKKVSFETPLFEVQGPDHQLSPALSDEFRFGTVRRGTDNLASPSLVRSTKPSRTNTGKNAFAKEHTVVLTSDSAVNGGRLIDHRQGNVVDDSGSVKRSAVTRQELRALFQWFSNLSSTRAEIDESGNWSVENAQDSLEGGTMSIPSGGLRIGVGKGLSLTSGGDTSITSTGGRLFATGTQGFRVFSPAFGEVSADQNLLLRGGGGVSINTPTYQGVRVGGGLNQQHPVLLATPQYIRTLQSLLGAHAGFSASAIQYGQSASTAWGAVGPLLAILDPSATVTQQCLTAAGSAAALTVAAQTLMQAIVDHLGTLGTNPTGFQSTKLVSE